MTASPSVPPTIVGDATISSTWRVFGPVDPTAAPPELQGFGDWPASLKIGDATFTPCDFQPIRGQVDLRAILGPPPLARDKVAWVFIRITTETPGPATIGFGADSRIQAWLNAQPLMDGQVFADTRFPATMNSRLVTVELRAGVNLLALRFSAGRASAVLAVGGPQELRAGDFRSILADPLLRDARWTAPQLRAAAGTRSAIDINSRRELFVDDHLIDTLTGTAQRRLHHPSPREVVITLDQPWEGNFSGNFMPTVVLEDQGRFLLYYYGANCRLESNPSRVLWGRRNESPTPSVTCLATSDDGIHFTRPKLGLYEVEGSRDNNIVWWTKQYFTPFKDTNPAAPADQRFKAICNHPAGGLGVFASPDGIHWRALCDDPVIRVGAFDSQNLAFWDTQRHCYVEFHRGQHRHQRERGIMTSTSTDFLHWSEPRVLEYTDERLEDMYTNCIQPYPRAPHLYLGTPARFVMPRTKFLDHPEYGISDAILMSSRDGVRFDRWEEGFVRPSDEPQAWTDRNNYLACGMLQTSPAELSLYWCEHNGHDNPRLRRGVLRTDGFVSLHAPGSGVGECLTRPLRFTGRKLEINYATSAIGTILIELCDEAGRPIDGFTFADCDPIFGNELAHVVQWNSHCKDLTPLAGQPVRLRIRLHDADLFSLRFAAD